MLMRSLIDGFQHETHCLPSHHTGNALHCESDNVPGFCNTFVDCAKSIGFIVLLLNYARKLLHPIYIISERLQGMLATKVKNGFTLNDKEKEIYSQVTWLQNYHCYISDFCKAIEITGFNYTYKQIVNKGEVLFGCVKEDGIISQFLLKNAKEGTIVCSATIGDKDSFIENMGYKYNSNGGVCFINIDSSFDFSSSPIYIDNEVKINYNNKKCAQK